MPLILASNSASGGYNVANSLRFNQPSSDYLIRTPASTTNQKTYTISTWIKIGNYANFTTFWSLFNCMNGGATNRVTLFLSSSGQLVYELYDGANYYEGYSVQLLRDPSAWYHIVLSIDTSQATASNRVRLYVNNSEVTSFSPAATYPSQNFNTSVNTSSNSNSIGARITPDRYYDGYLTEYYLIDGQQLTPTSFGETDFDSGIWKPIPYTGSFGTNGFYLQFKNSGSLGLDSSGNANNFTVNNLTSIDQTTDTCTNNFATLNPLIPNSSITYTEGNLGVTQTFDANYRTFRSTIAVSSGKWYAEFKAVSGFDSIDKNVGIVNAETAYSLTSNTSAFVGGYSYGANGNITEYNASVIDIEATYTNGDIIGIALDLTNNKLYFSKNGTFVNSANPSAGTNGYSITSGQTYYFAGSVINFGGANLWNCNFGNPPFTISSGNADAEGFGNFEYAVPSGYFALCSKNLAEYA